MDQIKEKIDFIEVAKKLIEKTKARETKVLFRLFPIRGVMLDQTNLEFFKQTLPSLEQVWGFHEFFFLFHKTSDLRGYQ